MGFFNNLFGRRDGSRGALPSPSPVQGSVPVGMSPQSFLFELFRGHGLAPTVQGDWVLPTAELPAVRGTWHPGERHGRLDVEVLVRDGVMIQESFAGVGAGVVGMADGLRSFTVNSFHVLLSALWSRHDAEQVIIEPWTVAGRSFRAHVGNVGTRSSSDVAPSIPRDLLPRLEAAIRDDSLDPDLHWFRFYVGHVSGELTLEALKDNEPWPAGVDALSSCEWGRGEGFYSARLFLVLRAA